MHHVLFWLAKRVVCTIFQHHSNRPIFLPQHQEAKDETTASEAFSGCFWELHSLKSHIAPEKWWFPIGISFLGFIFRGYVNSLGSIFCNTSIKNCNLHLEQTDPWANCDRAMRYSRLGIRSLEISWNIPMEFKTSRELTYPPTRAFWRWFSFSPGGIC